MVEDLSTFDFSSIDGKPSDISDLWFNSYVSWANRGIQLSHYSDPGPDKSKIDLYKKYGWLDKDGSVKFITYGNYEYGFRTPLISKESLVVCGCSNTFGTALNIEQTWGYKLAKELDLPLVNLALPGASSDQVYRIVKTFLPKLNPKYIACLMPDATRHEFFFRNWIDHDSEGIKDSNIQPRSANLNTFEKKKAKKWLNFYKYAEEYMNQNCSTLEYQLSNYNRNIDAIKGIYNSSYFLSSQEYMNKGNQNSLARDLRHFGENWHSMIAKDFLKLIKK
jgi:hypothetical protein